MAEKQLVDDFTQTSSTYFAERIEYESVQCLIIYWAENDLSPDQEIKNVRKVFENDYQFPTATFPIPAISSQARLNKEITSLVHDYGQKSNSLIIVYYAGHCFTSNKREALWAAYEEGGPTLHWSQCQQNLFAALGDVLLILDCCEAANPSPGSKAQGRFELLAACAKGVATPAPGTSSFTSLLLGELRRSKDAGVSAKDLAETPFYADLARNKSTSIFLRPLQTPAHFIRKPKSFVFFRASLSDDVGGLELADWLKTAPPQFVTAVNIEAVVMKARNLQRQVVANSEAFPSGSILSKLAPPVQEEILRHLRRLNTVMANSESDSQDESKRNDSEMTTLALQSIEEAVANTSSAIETPLLLDCSEQELEEALGDRSAWAADARDTITLRQALLQEHAITDSLEVAREKIRLDINRKGRFCAGTIEKRQVLVEFLDYEPDDNSGELDAKSIQRAEKMASLLCHPKRTSFHILPGVGYVNDPVDHRLGLIFETPYPAFTSLKASPSMLLELYNIEDRLALGKRIRLAHAVAVALENLHRVGWVHKSIRSSNIFFLPSTSHLTSLNIDLLSSTELATSPVDLAMPWLFGFDYARPDQHSRTTRGEDNILENNLYRHPDRWNKPTADFMRAHDVYSLGIVLIEIGLWQDIVSRLSIDKHKRLSRNDYWKKLKEICRKELPFHTGEIFAKVVSACLSFKKATAGFNEYQMQKHFQDSIIGPLSRLVGKV